MIMKKPVKEYETEYAVSPESESYYGSCESGNFSSCNSCNESTNTCSKKNK